jgi:hypothetical protein
MKLTYISCVGLIAAGSTLLLANAPAQAFSFTTNFTAAKTGKDLPKGDITLNSVKLSNGSIVDQFSLVNRAVILQNDAYRGGDTGAASSDRGDLAHGIKVEDPTNADVVKSLGNLNLNNIIDTEDTGSFKMNLFFDSPVTNLFFWERGQNSKLGLQAIDAAGNLLGNFLTLDSSKWDYAGFDINTTEIGSAQPVGSKGFNLADLNVSGPIAGIQLTSKRNYNGPDFKVVGSKSVPEPATLAGLSLIGGAILTRRRKAAKQA